ncbi:hypothetical protein COOONC_14066 [Cooperia oncophora]
MAPEFTTYMTIVTWASGLYVRTTYGKKKTFPIGNLADAANVLKFETADGKQLTVEQYFKEHYNIQLRCVLCTILPVIFTGNE